MGSEIHNTDYTIKGPIQHKQDAIEAHFIIGFFVFFLLFSRIIWSKFILHESRKPKFNSPTHKKIVLVVHYSMYLVIFSLIITGLLMINNYEHPLYILNFITFSTGEIIKPLFRQANEMHLYLQNVLYYLIAIHFAGAMYNKR